MKNHKDIKIVLCVDQDDSPSFRKEVVLRGDTYVNIKKDLRRAFEMLCDRIVTIQFIQAMKSLRDADAETIRKETGIKMTPERLKQVRKSYGI